MTGSGSPSPGDTDGREASRLKRRDLLQMSGVAAGLGIGSTALVNRAAAGAHRPVHRLLWQNVWMVDGVVDSESDIAKPENEERAEEFGRRFKNSGLDVLALGEAFAPEHRAEMRRRIEGEVDWEIGPEEGLHPDAPANSELYRTGPRYKKSSGLYTLGVGETPIVASERHEFEANGWETRDADAHSRKGVLYTRHEIGDGAIDLFTTHLIAGDDFPEVFAAAGQDPPSSSEYRRQQLQEMKRFIEFVKEEYDPDGEVPTVCAGDFNINAGEDRANNPGEWRDEEYPWLLEFKDELGLYDAWLRHGGMDGDGVEDVSRLGGTDDESITRACEFDPYESPPSYCDGGTDDDASRKDFILVEDGRDDIEVHRVRRRVFWRKLAPPAQFWAEEYTNTTLSHDRRPNYLADHVGLEMEFSFASHPGKTHRRG